MFCLKKCVDYHGLKNFEEDSQRNALKYIIPIKQKLENVGYVVENNYLYETKKTVRKRKIYMCELSIYPSNINKSEAKKQFKLKVFRLFLYEKERLNKNSFKVILRNDLCFRFFIAFALKLLIVGDIEKTAKDNIFDFFCRVFNPSRTGELAFKYRGKDYEWIRVLLLISVIFIVGILAALKEADFLSSLGYGYY